MMRAAYTVFQEGSDPARILQAADSGRGSGSAFYANLVNVHTQTVHPSTNCAPCRQAAVPRCRLMNTSRHFMLATQKRRHHCFDIWLTLHIHISCLMAAVCRTLL